MRAKKLAAELNRAIGKRCWAVVAGQGNGSMVTLHLGTEIPRRTPLKNPAISNKLQHSFGEFCIFLQGCSWRLDDARTIICGWGEPEITIGQQLSRLMGTRLTGISVSDYTFDASLTFDTRYVLRLFCDQTAAEDTLDNYSVRTPDGSFRVGPKSRIKTELKISDK